MYFMMLLCRFKVLYTGKLVASLGNKVVQAMNMACTTYIVVESDEYKYVKPSLCLLPLGLVVLFP